MADEEVPDPKLVEQFIYHMTEMGQRSEDELDAALIQSNSDVEYLNPEYIDFDAGTETRIERLENSVQALLRLNFNRSTNRMLAEIKTERESDPEYSGQRKTPVRKAVTFNKEELAFLIAVMDSVQIELNMGEKANAIADRLYKEFQAIRYEWQNEAYNNREKF